MGKYEELADIIQDWSHRDYFEDTEEEISVGTLISILRGKFSELQRAYDTSELVDKVNRVLVEEEKKKGFFTRKKHVECEYICPIIYPSPTGEGTIISISMSLAGKSKRSFHSINKEVGDDSFFCSDSTEPISPVILEKCGDDFYEIAAELGLSRKEVNYWEDLYWKKDSWLNKGENK